MINEFSDEEIETIKNVFEEKMVISNNDKKFLNKLKNKMNTDAVSFGRVFLYFYDIFFMNLHIISNIEKDIGEKIENWIFRFHSVERLRYLFDEYGDGEEWGSHYIRDEIKILINKNRKNISEFVAFGMSLIGEEYDE